MSFWSPFSWLFFGGVVSFRWLQNWDQAFFWERKDLKNDSKRHSKHLKASRLMVWCRSHESIEICQGRLKYLKTKTSTLDRTGTLWRLWFKLGWIMLKQIWISKSTKNCGCSNSYCPKKIVFRIASCGSTHLSLKKCSNFMDISGSISMSPTIAIVVTSGRKPEGHLHLEGTLGVKLAPWRCRILHKRQLWCLALRAGTAHGMLWHKLL